MPKFFVEAPVVYKQLYIVDAPDIDTAVEMVQGDDVAPEEGSLEYVDVLDPRQYAWTIRDADDNCIDFSGW